MTAVSPIADRILSRLDTLQKLPSGASVEAGLSNGAIRDIITGRSKSPTIATLEALCGPLECTIGYLVGIETEKRDAGVTEIGKFWMVYGVGQRAPAYRHYSVSAATAEANRLAQQNPGIIFVVMEALCAVKADKPTITAIDVRENADDGIPF